MGSHCLVQAIIFVDRFQVVKGLELWAENSRLSCLEYVQNPPN